MPGIVGAAAKAEVPNSAAKAAVIHLTKCVAMELGESGIRVNSIAPGAIETPMFTRLTGDKPEVKAGITSAHPIGRPGKPEAEVRGPDHPRRIAVCSSQQNTRRANRSGDDHRDLLLEQALAADNRPDIAAAVKQGRKEITGNLVRKLPGTWESVSAPNMKSCPEYP